MSMKTLWTIENGALTLIKGAEGLQSLDLLFEVVLQATELRIVNAIKDSPTDGKIKITGIVNVWDSPTAAVEITYLEETQALLTLKLSKSIASFANLTLPPIVPATFQALTLNLNLAVPNQGDSSFGIITYQLIGELSLGSNGKIIPFSIDHPVDSGILLIESRFPSGTGPGIEDIAALLHPQGDATQDLNILPQALPQTNLVQLRDLQIRIDPENDDIFSMISITLDLREGNTWSIIPGNSWLAVSGMWLRLEVDYPLNAQYRFPILSLGGTIKIGDRESDGSIEIYARWPDFQIGGQLAEGSQIELGRLLSRTGLPISSFPQGDDALLINQLSFGAEPTSDPVRFNFLIDIENIWSIQLPNNRSLALTELLFSIYYVGGDQSQLRAHIRGSIRINTVDLRLDGRNLGSNVGWTFSGETGKGQKIPLGRLISDELAPKFGGFTPPAPIAGLEIENLAATFNTASKDFTFSGEAVLPMAEGSSDAVDFKLNIALKNQTNGSYSKRFDGLLTVKGLSFEVLFDSVRQVSSVGDPGSPNDSQTFLAIFQDPFGRSINIDDLLAPLGINVQTGLSFTIKKALLGYLKTSSSADPTATVPSATNGKWLFGIDIEGGLNLSAIHIDDLPFVSIPPNQTLKLNFQLLAASTTFTKEEIDALSGLAPIGSLTFPAKEINQIGLSMTLDFGTGSKAVDLPISLQTGTGTNGLALPGNNTVSTPQSGSGIATANQDELHWITLQKQLGPLAFERVGVKYANGEVSALLDASFSAGGLTIALNGLRMSSPINQFNPTFGLDGLGIDFKNASVEIGGTFLKEENGFAGLAVIKTEVLSISAIGAYAYTDGEPSLFIYAVLDYPIGGPAFFYVTGVAAGFGYNRRLVMPSIDQVAAFPLVQEATGAASATPLPTDQTSRAARLQQEIRSLSSAIPIEHGQYFLAVGIKFTSFKQIDSFALLAVQFGNRFEIDLLGLSTLKVPAPIGGEAVTPVAEAQLALRAVFIPSEGFLGVQAQLTSSSYILSRACRLTGGFAFYSWFSGEHEGDFVLTLGGYHPAFVVPAHYPTVPRLGFMWQVSNNFYLSGGLYFALTAHALMAGGRLEAVYQSGNQDSRFAIKAWFTASVDFLIAWKPYYYEIEVFVSLGLEIIVRYFGTHTVALSAGANLKLWGPEFGGEAHVQVKVLIFKISVDIAFGSRAGAVPAIDFDEFKHTYLPAKPEETCSVIIKSGLIDTVTENGRVIWLVNAKEMVLVTNSMIPSGRSAVFGQERDWDGSKPAIQPMGLQIDEVSTTHSVIFEGVSETDLEALVVKPITKKQPAALWGKPQLAASDPIRHVGGQRYVEKPQLNGERFVEDTLAGYEIRVGQSPIAGASKPVSTSVLRSEIETAGSVSEWRQFSLADPLGASAWQAAATSENLVHNQARDDILAALGMTQLQIDFGEFVTDHVKV